MLLGFNSIKYDLILTGVNAASIEADVLQLHKFFFKGSNLKLEN